MAGDVFVHGAQAVLQAPKVDALETRIEGKPGVLGVVRRLQHDHSVIYFRRIHGLLAIRAAI